MYAEELTTESGDKELRVRDLSPTRRFYGDILGCREGRSTETWVNFDFFGNQISDTFGTGRRRPEMDADRQRCSLI
jgi:extradiol dioxygenase family protein